MDVGLLSLFARNLPFWFVIRILCYCEYFQIILIPNFSTSDMQRVETSTSGTATFKRSFPKSHHSHLPENVSKIVLKLQKRVQPNFIT